MKKTIGNLTVRIGANTKQFDRAMDRTGKRTGRLSRQFSRLGTAMAGAFGIYAVGSVIKNAIRKNIQFEKAMADVKAITKATGTELQALESDALRLGASTEHTSSAVAGLQKEFGKLGFSTKEILNATGATLDLATATGEELARSAEVAGATIRGFGLDAKETRRVVDLMAASFTSSALDLERFGESMKYVAPIAKVAGIEIEEVTAHLSALADAGIHGSMAGTALKKIYSKLSTEGKTMGEVFSGLAEEGIGLSEAEKLVGERGKAALLVLTGQTEKLGELEQAYIDAGGAAKDMADIQRNTLSGSLAKLSSAYEGLILQMREGNGVLKQAVDLMTSMVGAFGGDHGQMEVMVDGVMRQVDMTALENVQLTSALLMEQMTGSSGMLDKFKKHLADKWRAINKTEEEGVNEFASLTDEQLQTNLKNFETAWAHHSEKMKSAMDEYGQYSDEFKHHFDILGDLESGMKSMNDELDRRNGIVDEGNEGVVEAVEETHTWAESLSDLESQLAANNKVLQETLDLGIAKEIITENKAIEEQIKLRKIQVGLMSEQVSLAKAPSIPSSGISGGGYSTPGIAEGGFDAQVAEWEASMTYLDGMALSMDNVAMSAQNMQDVVTSAAISMGAAISDTFEALAKNQDAGSTFFNGLIAVVAQFMEALGQSLLAAGMASLAFKSLLASPGLSIAAGIALMAASGLVRGMMSDAPELAKGGLAFGPTMAMVGDNPGAQTNPEVIAPLDKLQNMMGGGRVEVEGQFRIRGTDLVVALDRANDRIKQYS